MKGFPFLAFLWLLSCTSCGTDPAASSSAEATPPPSASAPYYSEPFRPQVHFSPERGGMYAPNGLVFLDGIYHLYYQHNPDSTVGGSMHWGHATSRNLVDWDHMPIAIRPEGENSIFSGSIVADVENTAGFAKDGKAALVALYTNHDMAAEKASAKDYETQHLGYSSDGGITFTKADINPVLPNPGLKDFRAPKVSWHDASSQWVMALAAGDRVKFYTSPDLKAWTFASDFGMKLGSHGGVWENPDLFEIQEEFGQKKHFVLLVSVVNGAPAGGSGTSYFVGDFDGKRFTASAGANTPLWLDEGSDNYAFVTFDNSPTPDKNRLGIGWMSNWMYAQKVPSRPWRSAMTVARVLSLQNTEAGLRIRSTPVPDYYKLRELESRFNRVSDRIATDLYSPMADWGNPALDIVLSTPAGKVPNFKLELTSTGGDTLSFGFDVEDQVYYIDRRGQHSSREWQEGFAERLEAPRKNYVRGEQLRIILDRSSVEMFADEGYTPVTASFFSKGELNGVRLLGDAGMSGTLYSLRTSTPTPESVARVKLGLD